MKETLKNNLKPFVKWAGGKTQLLDVLKNAMPNKYNTYFEPFLGGGALFFSVMPKNAVINDYNKELMTAYKCFSNDKNYSLMVKEILNHQKNHNEEYFLEIRNIDREENYYTLSDYKKAARLIYLNKACFNGLYRVNQKGFFNVPSAKRKVVNAYDEILFKGIKSYFDSANINILTGDFEKAVQSAKSGDFVYFDPPYDNFEGGNNFTTYTKNSFNRSEQIRLANLYKELDKRGVYVMLSNHNTKFIRELYRDFNIKVHHARRNINSKGDGRGNVEEVVITNYRK